METVLVIGASGNIGVSVIIAAIRTGRKVLAVVRNEASAQKLFKHVGDADKKDITITEADVLSEDGIQQVVSQVRQGKLPAFQHVYATVGVLEPATPMYNMDTATFRANVRVNIEANFFAYRATLPYLLEKGGPNATFTLITGGAGEYGMFGVTAVTQGALFSLANVGCRETRDTNVRFNEVYLAYRVDYDSVAEELGGDRIKSSDFARVYEAVLANKKIDACRVRVASPNDIDDLKFQKKLPE